MYYARVPLTIVALIAVFCASCVNESDHAQTVSSGPDNFDAADSAQVSDDLALPDRNGSIELKVVDELPVSMPSDSFDIVSSKFVEDTLQLEVSYGGGCEDHVFAAFWAPVFLEEAPESTEILITHDANRDSCEAIISQNVTIDLMPIRKMRQTDGALNETSELSLTLLVGGRSITHIPRKN